MRSMIKLLAVFALVLGSFGQNTNVLATDRYKLQGLGVSAFFSDLDPTGCITTSTSIIVSQQLTQSEGTRDVTEVMFMNISQDNICTNTPLISVSADVPLPEGAFDIQGNLASATLDTTVTVINNITDSSIELEIHLDWTATSTVLSSSGHNKFRFGSCHTQLRFDEKIRFATASGTVSDGIINFTPSPSSSADIFNSKETNFSHGCD